MYGLVASAEDEALERARVGRLGDEEVAELGPVELDLVRGKGGLELAHEVVGDADVVRVGAQVGEREVRRKVIRMEQTQQEARHGAQWPHEHAEPSKRKQAEESGEGVGEQSVDYVMSATPSVYDDTEGDERWEG